MAHLQLVDLAVVVHVQVGDLDSQLVELAIRLPNLRNETNAVLIPEIRGDLLVDARIFADETRKERLSAGRFGE